MFSFSSFSQTKEQVQIQPQEAFKRHLHKGDSCFTARDFLTAKFHYLNALALKDDVSVQKRIKELDVTIKFEEYIQQADEFFALKAYRDALKFYERALVIKASIVLRKGIWN